MWRANMDAYYRSNSFGAEMQHLNIRFGRVVDNINYRHLIGDTSQPPTWATNPESWQFGDAESSQSWSTQPYYGNRRGGPVNYTPQMVDSILRHEGLTPRYVARHWTRLHRELVNPQFRLLVGDDESSYHSSRASSRNSSRPSSRGSDMTDID